MSNSDYESITVSSTAIGITGALITAIKANRAIITVETDQVRWRIDGTDPTSSEGHLLSAGDVLTLISTHDLNAFRAIRVTGDATLKVTIQHLPARMLIP